VCVCVDGSSRDPQTSVSVQIHIKLAASIALSVYQCTKSCRI